jgi:hypothetical protein
MIKLKIVPITVLILVGVLSVGAHHSQTLYDLTQSVTYEGMVSRVSWSNPHTFFFIDGATIAGSNGPAVERLGVEGPGPGSLEREYGWAKDSLKIGDKIQVIGNPRKDGKPMLLLRGVTLPNGKKLNAKPE